MKASGMNAVESYVFWNYHVRTLDEHNAGTADYSGRGNVTLFLELAAKADLFVIWRLGLRVLTRPSLYCAPAHPHEEEEEATRRRDFSIPGPTSPYFI